MNEKAKKYFTGLHTAERSAICRKCGISLSWLMQCIYCGRSVSIKLANRLEKATFGAVAKEDLRPDINWDLISN